MLPALKPVFCNKVLDFLGNSRALFIPEPVGVTIGVRSGINNADITEGRHPHANEETTATGDG